MSVCIVVAKYKEDIQWLKTQHKVIIYDKSDTPVPGSIHLKNIGREGETFLYHIINNYDNLDDVTIFMQCNPFDHVPMLVGWRAIKSDEEKRKFCEKLNTEINSKSEFASLYSVLYDHPNFTNGSDATSAAKLYFGESYDCFTCSPGAQYIVPKKYILSRPLYVWKALHRAMYVTQTLDAWCMETLWYVAFNGKMNEKFGDHDTQKSLCMNGKFSFNHTPYTYYDFKI